MSTKNADQLARVRRLLEQIGRAAQHGPLDLDTMDDIARDSLAALRALDEAEGRTPTEQLKEAA